MAFVRPVPAYTSALLPPDQFACATSDLVHGNGTAWSSLCRGSEAENYGLTPVTLYGVPGVEFQLATNSFDGRVQFTNSSPANPQGLTSNNQHLQWTLGGGYRFGPGIHVGVAEFFGPYLDGSLEPLLSEGQNLGHFNALGLGLDAQWSRGRWALEGEWQRFRFELPGFAQSPRVEVAYGQAKRIISPRVFAATRLSTENFGAISDQEGFRLPNFQAPRKAVEVSLGYRPNRLQVIKAGLGLSTFTSSSLSGYPWKYTVEIELVTSFVPLAQSFR
ncbi:MAG TPA: hypothetical protein VH325_12495 [Bryobacteraceae bacterium]|jgi:hypothetical protein|nr:hypothetical protein [Bryobacteraceae bacterium]